MGVVKDITGQRFGKLVAVTLEYVDRSAHWLCRCDCGQEVHAVLGGNLRAGLSRSCGCTRRNSPGHRTHGKRWTPEYQTWARMMTRCENPRSDGYARYGARGIKVIGRLRNFEGFITVMGSKPSPQHQIDRIDPGGNYEEGNVRWVTPKEQQRNRRSNLILEFRGERLPAVVWAERFGLKPVTLHSRLRRGWPVEKTLTTPVPPRPFDISGP